ncbi:MAG: flagellar motor switch protein FliN [Vulcanimicrobiota bacterium]
MSLESTLQSLRSWMVSSCETLSIILNQGVYPDEAVHEQISAEDINYKAWTGVAFPVSLFGGVEGEFSLLLERQRAVTLIDLLVGGSGGEASEEFTALHQSVLQEAIQQLVGGLSDMLSQLRGQPVKVRLSPSVTELRPDASMEPYLWWDCPISLDEGAGFGLTLLLPHSLLEQMKPASAPKPPAAAAAPKRSSLLAQMQPLPDDEEESGPEPTRPRFEALAPAPAKAGRGQLDLILDVPLQVQVVLGRTSMMVQDLIHLVEGSILELDKLAGEPVELLVHDRLVAYGEVIVVDERFGVKVLELASDRRNLRPAASM